MQGLNPILSIVCPEPEAQVVRHVYPLIFTEENIQKLADKALQFPTIFGREVKDVNEMMSLFFEVTPQGVKFRGPANFFVIDDFIGLFSITDFTYNYSDAIGHYTFFDRRHKGRIPLVRAMLKYVFDTYKLNRISVEIPLFTSPEARHFVGECGFTLEGKRRKGIKYKNEWYDILLFGILKSEVITGARLD